MSDVSEDDFQAAKEEAISAVIEMLRLADALGKDQQLTAIEFLAAFQAAAQEALT